jgi:hypothetical protein
MTSVPNRIMQRKPPAKRLFSGMAGSALARVSEEPFAAQAAPQQGFPCIAASNGCTAVYIVPVGQETSASFKYACPLHTPLKDACPDRENGQG